MSKAIAVLVVLTQLCASSLRADEVCFSAQDVPIVEVLQQAPPPPKIPAPRYAYFPVSSFATMRIDKIAASQVGMPMYFAQWANHGPRRTPKSNVGPGIRAGGTTSVLFSSIERADACTMAQTAIVLGDEAGAKAFAQEKVQLRHDLSPGSFTDVCFLNDQALVPRAAGIFFDFEVGDGRTPDRTKNFLVAYAEYVHAHGKKVLLYTDPLNAPSQRLTGITSDNLPAIVDAFDLTDIMLWGANRERDIGTSFEDQKGMIGPWRPDKIFVVFELARTSVEDARTVASLMKRNEIRTISFWRDLARQGGNCDTPVNKKIACLALGRCQ